MKTLARVVVGSRLHSTANEQSDWDYRGIYADDLKDALSPFQTHKVTSWIEGDEDNTSYELREFCRLATKGSPTILEVLFSDQVIETSPEHKVIRENWKKFMDTRAFIRASRGYANNQYKKALSYDDLGERGQLRTAKFIIAFIRVMWQCSQYLLHDTFECSLEACSHIDFIRHIKGVPREELDIPLCFAKMEEVDRNLLQAEEWCKQNTPEVYNRKPDIPFIEQFLHDAYVSPIREVGQELLKDFSRHAVEALEQERRKNDGHLLH